MKNNTLNLKLTLMILMLFVFLFQGFSLEYIITFTSSNPAVILDSTVVQNINQGTSVTVQSGQVLRLTDENTGTSNFTIPDNIISVSPNPVKDFSKLLFYAPKSGNIRINISDISGRRILSTNHFVETGLNEFQLQLPVGIFIVSILGDEIKYSEKVISSSINTIKPSISSFPDFVSKQKTNTVAGVLLGFNIGDMLIYNSISGKNTTSLSDSPTSNNTIIFQFFECKDASNNYYPISKIGDYYWMSSNLNTSKYRNGEDIPNVTDANDWKYLYSPGWCEQNNDPNNGHIYGKLYNFYAIADSRNIAPEGWHVATKEEYVSLVNHVKTHWGFIVSETKALADKDGWKESTLENTPGFQPWLNNFSGFYGKPGGDRGGFYNGTFFNLGEVGFWWTSTDNFSIQDATYLYIPFDVSYTILSTGKKQYGMSVRCVKDY